MGNGVDLRSCQEQETSTGATNLKVSEMLSM